MKRESALKQLRELKKLGKRSDEMRLAAESWKNDYKVLVATILSARTRDEVTIPVAEKLFKRFPSPKTLANTNIKEIRKLVKPVNFYKNKSNNIRACAQNLVKLHKGVVPREFGALISLPGVGRKTANVFLAETGKSEIGVDTHVAYVSSKLGWTSGKNQEQIEKDLKLLFPKKYWGKVNETLVRFGKTHTSRKRKDALLREIKKIK